MADYRNWLKRCVYRKHAQQELVLYQGLGPGNTAFIFYGLPGLEEQLFVDCFAQYGGKYGQQIHWLFQQKGQVLVSKWQSGIDENTLLLEGLGAGADDALFDDGDLMEILTKPHKLQNMLDILELEDIPVLQAGFVWMPQALVPVEDTKTITLLWGLLEEMTAMEGIVNVTADFWVADEKLENFV